MNLKIMGYFDGQVVYRSEVPMSTLGGALRTTVGLPKAGIVIDQLSVQITEGAQQVGQTIAENVIVRDVGPARPEYSSIEDENKAGLDALEEDRRRRREVLAEEGNASEAETVVQ